MLFDFELDKVTEISEKLWFGGRFCSIGICVIGEIRPWQQRNGWPAVQCSRTDFLVQVCEDLNWLDFCASLVL